MGNEVSDDPELDIQPIALPPAEWIGMASSDAGSIAIAFKIPVGDSPEMKAYVLPVSAAQAQEFLFILWNHAREKGWATADLPDPASRQ